MRIEKKKKEDCTTFGQLKCGDVFQFNDQYFLKVDASKMEYNSVNLADGHGYWFELGVSVKRCPDAVLYVK